MADVILFFASNADTMIATKALKDGGIAAKMIPKPAHVSATANLALWQCVMEALDDPSVNELLAAI